MNREASFRFELLLHAKRQVFSNMISRFIHSVFLMLALRPAFLPAVGLALLVGSGQAAMAQAWLTQANQRIEQHRKADLTLEVVDSLGTPVPGADVRVEMKGHTFGWGTAVTASRINSTSPNSITYKEKLLENFNQVVFENDLKWPSWLGGNWSATQQALDWLDTNGLPARGHYLSWATEDGGSNYDGGDDNHSTLEARLYSHITDKMQTVENRVFEWDVINHPVGWTNQTYENDPDVNEGTDIFKQIIDHARSVATSDPDIPDDQPLWINEDSIIRGSGNRADDYERIIQYLVDNGSAPDGIGFQAHFIDDWNGVTTDYQGIYDKIDRFAQFGLPLRVTEFDIKVGSDETLQGTLMNHYLTVIFSHPDIEAVTMWGFWENQIHMPDAALYRSDWSEKPSLTAYQDLVFDAWWTDETGVSDSSGEHDTRAFKGQYDITVTYNGQDYVLNDLVLDADMNVQIELDDVFISPIEDADFNDDDIVDGADFLIWQRGLGTGTTLAEGDANGDMIVDHADLLLWEAQYGTSGGLSSHALAVPEPGTFFGSSCLFCLFLSRRTRGLGQSVARRDTRVQ